MTRIDKIDFLINHIQEEINILDEKVLAYKYEIQRRANNVNKNVDMQWLTEDLDESQKKLSEIKPILSMLEKEKKTEINKLLNEILGGVKQ